MPKTRGSSKGAAPAARERKHALDIRRDARPSWPAPGGRVAMKRGNIYVSTMIVAVAVPGVATSESVEGCSLRSLKGIYGISGSGTVAGTVQAGFVGLNSFDGAGGCDVSVRLNAGGTVVPLSAAECSYTVNADGT